MKLGAINRIKLILTILGLILVCSCSEEKTKINNEQNNSFNLFNEMNELEKFTLDFKEICVNSNIMDSYNIENITLENIRGSYMKFDFKNQNLSPIYYEKIKHLFCYIYDYSDDATLNNYGYIISQDFYIINKTKKEVYYIVWSNLPTKTPNIGKGIFSNTIDSTTRVLYTNIDSNLIRKKYDYKGIINDRKIDTLKLKNDGHRKFYLDIDSLKIF